MLALHRVDTVPRRPLSLTMRWFCRLAALLTVGIVAFVYASSMAAGRAPISHPFSGLTLTLLALALVAMSFANHRAGRGIAILLSLLSCLGAFAWLTATNLQG